MDTNGDSHVDMNNRDSAQDTKILYKRVLSETDSESRNSSCESKRIKYSMDNVDENYTTQYREVKTTENTNNEYNTRSQEETSFDIDKFTGMKKENDKFRINSENESVNESNENLSNKMENIEIVIKKNKVLNTNKQKDGTEGNIESIKPTNETCDDQVKIEHILDGDQKYDTQNNYKIGIQNVEVKVENIASDHIAEEVVNHESNANLEATNATAITCEKSDTEQLEANNENAEKKENCDENNETVKNEAEEVVGHENNANLEATKAAVIICEKSKTEQLEENNENAEKKENCDENNDTVKNEANDHLSLRTQYLRSVFLDVRNKLFIKLNPGFPCLYGNTNFCSVSKINLDKAEAVRVSNEFRKNEFSNILFKNVTVVYSYFQEYFHDIYNIRERKHCDDDFEAKARKFLTKRFCSAYYVCYRNMPSNILLPDLDVDVEYKSHLINEAKKLTNDTNFNEKLFSDIIDTFIRFLPKYQKYPERTEPQTSSIDIMQQARIFDVQPSNPDIPLPCTESVQAHKNNNDGTQTIVTSPIQSELDSDERSPRLSNSREELRNEFYKLQPWALENYQQSSEFDKWIDETLLGYPYNDPIFRACTSTYDYQMTRSAVLRNEPVIHPFFRGCSHGLVRRLTNNRINPTQTADSGPINFAKNAADACLVCKINTTRRCKHCSYVFICSEVCETAAMHLQKSFNDRST